MRKTVMIVVFTFLALVVLPEAVQQTRAQAGPYPAMAPLEEYLMPKDAEIALARSAAPPSIADDASVMVLGRHGYETAVQGKNGFLCYVERSWAHFTDHPEFWNPKMRAPNCFNAVAARSVTQIYLMKTRLVLAGKSKAEIAQAVAAALDSGDLPALAPGAMCYMMSKQQYFGDKIGNAGDSHLMFWFPQGGHVNWGADASDSPVNVHQYSPQPITEFSISTSKWSDGTPVGDNQ